MTPRSDQESFVEYMTRWLEYWERVEPVNEYEIRSR